MRANEPRNRGSGVRVRVNEPRNRGSGVRELENEVRELDREARDRKNVPRNRAGEGSSGDRCTHLWRRGAREHARGPRQCEFDARRRRVFAEGAAYVARDRGTIADGRENGRRV